MSHFHDALGLEISCACAAAALFFDFLTPDDIWAPRGRVRRGPFQERASCLLWPQQGDAARGVSCGTHGRREIVVDALHGSLI